MTEKEKEKEKEEMKGEEMEVTKKLMVVLGREGEENCGGGHRFAIKPIGRI